jgi:hypothetical protein
MFRRIWLLNANISIHVETQPSEKSFAQMKMRMNEYEYKGSWQQDLKNLKSKPCTEWPKFSAIEEQFSKFFMNEGECGV